MNNIFEIIIADDHKMLADGLETIIHENHLGIVTAKVSNGKELLHQLNSIKADMIILDVNMPEMDGLKAAAMIKAKYPNIKILVVSQHESIELVKKFYSLDVNGFLSKSLERDDLINAILLLKADKKIFPILDKTPNTQEKKFLFINSEKYKLSEREYEIIIMISKGMTTKQIAGSLFLSEFTVETHRKNIGRKTGANNPSAIIRFAYENNITV